MKIYKDFEQWTEDWFNIRKLKMTGSNANTISVAGKWLDTYILDLISEYYSSWEKEIYTNEHIERGKELECTARQLYELETWNTIEQVAFIEYSEFIWVSPDWLVWDDWLIEIKCKGDKAHFKLLINWIWNIEKEYIAQIQMQMFVTNRVWCDFISFNPNYKKSLIIHRITQDLEFIEKLKKGLLIWQEKIKKICDIYENILKLNNK